MTLSDDTPIYPTETCFDDSLDYLTELAKAKLPFKHLILVHGICTFSNGELYAHSWVEDHKTGFCIIAGIIKKEKYFLLVPRKEYRDSLEIKEETFYSVKEALWLNQITNSYGPWEEKYLLLCNNRGN